MLKKAYLKKTLSFIDSELELMHLTVEYSELFQKFPTKKRKAHWTGSAVELVEFVYASLECKSFNDGDIEIKELIADLCEYFGFNVNGCYRALADIKRRPGDRTKYIDKLKMKLMDKLEKSDREHVKRKRP